MKTTFALGITLFALNMPSTVFSQDAAQGEVMFKQACATCHSLTTEQGSLLGPALHGVTKRPGRTDAWLTQWISDPQGMIGKKDPLAIKLLNQYNKVPMTNMLQALKGGDKTKIMKATKDILAFLKLNDAKTPKKGKMKRKKKG